MLVIFGMSGLDNGQLPSLSWNKKKINDKFKSLSTRIWKYSILTILIRSIWSKHKLFERNLWVLSNYLFLEIWRLQPPSWNRSFDAFCSEYSKLFLLKMLISKYREIAQIIFCSTQFLGQISQTKSESNVPTFEGCQTKIVRFDLSNILQWNIPPVLDQMSKPKRRDKKVNGKTVGCYLKPLAWIQ